MDDVYSFRVTKRHMIFTCPDGREVRYKIGMYTDLSALDDGTREAFASVVMGFVLAQHPVAPIAAPPAELQ
ncbi:MAG: hypothetical protein IPH07_23450 [Deltaproteobacteria bacterium]|nr:hypothetical protein [Deltaproteobacteria bacterium]